MLNSDEFDAWLARFGRYLESEDFEAVSRLFDDECYWRDLLSFTWNIKTLEGRKSIKEMLALCAPGIMATDWKRTGVVEQTDDGCAAWVEFKTGVATCRARVTLNGDLCKTMFTAMDQLIGYEEPVGAKRPAGVTHGPDRDRKTWSEKRLQTEAKLGHSVQPEVLIVGGGQGGLALAARLKQLDVSTLVVEQNARVGDSWRQRYRSLVLHDPVWYDHLPYLPFPENWPIFCPKDKMGDWLEAYAKIFELDIWTSSKCQSAEWQEADKNWSVTVIKEGIELEVRPKQLVFCTGAYGPPRWPNFPGQETFEGEFLHSSQYQAGSQFSGRRVIVIGSGSSAHDVAVDLWEAKADVTMIQRRPSIVVRSETLMEFGFEAYSQKAVDAGLDTDEADMLGASVPYALFADKQKRLYEKIRVADSDFYQRLGKAGFAFDFGEDDSGLMMRALRTASGYYIDVGGSSLIADGEIRVVSGSVEALTKDGLKLASGGHLAADVIIACTGYQSMNEAVAKIANRELADQLGPCWGLGSGIQGDPGPWQGELRNMWKPTAHPSLWFHGGNLALSRFYSRFVALQLKAREAGIETRVFGRPDPL